MRGKQDISRLGLKFTLQATLVLNAPTQLVVKTQSPYHLLWKEIRVPYLSDSTPRVLIVKRVAARVSTQWRSQAKNVWDQKLGGSKIFNFRRITLSC